MNIEVKNLSVQHRHGALAVNNLSFSVGKGQLLTVLGDNESGKTSLLKAIAGLYTITGGYIYFDQKEGNKMPIKDRKVCLMHEDGGFFNHRSVLFNLEYPFKIRKQKFDCNCLRFISTNILHKKISKLTTEEKIDVMFERMSNRTDVGIYLFDDPFKKLPENEQEKYFDKYLPFILSLKENAAVIFATTDHKEAEKLHSEVILLHYGTEQQRGRIEDFSDQPNSLCALYYSNVDYSYGMTTVQQGETPFVQIGEKIINLNKKCFLNEIYIGKEVIYAQTDKKTFLFDKNCEQRIYFD